MKYIAAGYTMVNDLFFSDGSRAEGILGGSVFSAAAMALFSDGVGYVGTAGPDFERLFGPCFRQSGIACAVRETLPETHCYQLYCQPDGRWTERHARGAAYEEEVRPLSRLRASFFAPFCSEKTKGIYLEAALNAGILEELSALRAMAPRAALMWEVATQDVEEEENRPLLFRLIKQAGLYSVNLPEACQLFCADDEEGALLAIARFAVPCFFRVGEKGAYFVKGGRAVFVPSLVNGQTVDATGCGNASTAAALVGVAEGLPLAQAVAMGNVAAFYTARQYGPLQNAPALQNEARALVRSLAAGAKERALL